MSNGLDPDQDYVLLVLIWVQTVCQGLFTRRRNSPLARKEFKKTDLYLLSEDCGFSGWAACTAVGGGGSSIEASVACMACSIADDGFAFPGAPGVGEAEASDVAALDASPPPLKKQQNESIDLDKQNILSVIF